MAAGAEVRSFGALLWVNALPAAASEFLPDDGLSNTLDAALAALGPVPLFIVKTSFGEFIDLTSMRRL